MNKSPAQMPHYGPDGTQKAISFPPYSPPSVPSSYSPPLILSAIDGRERFTVRGHTVVLISLSRLGGISTSLAETHHRVAQLGLTKQREDRGRECRRTNDLHLCLHRCPSVHLCLSLHPHRCWNRPSVRTLWLQLLAPHDHKPPGLILGSMENIYHVNLQVMSHTVQVRAKSIIFVFVFR